MLPKIISPTYELSIPEIDQKIHYRPLIVKEFKALLQSKVMGQEAEFIQTVRNIINSCIVNDNNIDIDNLPIYVMDFLFLKIRAKSIGNIVEAQYKCLNSVPNNIEPPSKIEDIVDGFEDTSQEVKWVDCGAEFKVFINLDDVILKFPENYKSSSTIELTPDIGIKLKSPTFKVFRSVVLKDKSISDITDEYVFACVDTVYDGDNILVPFKDFTLQELKDFINDFPATVIDNIVEFFTNQPSVNLTLNITCPKCRNQTIVELNGLEDFFA